MDLRTSSLLICFLHSFFLWGQSDTLSNYKKPPTQTKDTSKSELSSKFPKASYKMAFRISPEKFLFGEGGFSVENRFGPFGTEVSTNYVYYEFLRYNRRYRRTETKGVSVQTTFRFYFKNYFFKYIAAGTQFKFVERPVIDVIPVRKRYQHEGPFCTDCEGRSQVNKTAWTYSLIVGDEWEKGRFFLDLYGGLGFRKKIYDITVYEIFKPDYGREVFTFNDYRYKLYRYSPILLGGIRCGIKI